MFAWSKLPRGLEGPGSGIVIQVCLSSFLELCCSVFLCTDGLM